MKDQVTRTLPHSESLEEGVLAAILMDSSAMGVVSRLLTNEMFYQPKHRTVYIALEKMHKMGNPIDLLTITEYLLKMGRLDEVGGPYFLVELTTKLASTANLEAHAVLVREYYIKRQLIGLGHKIVAKSYNGITDVFKLIQASQQSIDNITQSIPNSGKDFSGIFDEVRDDIIRMANGEKSPIGLPTGWSSIDLETLGWHSPELVIVAGRPGMGKTAFALQTGLAASKARKGTVVFASYEMKDTQLMRRLISLETGISKDSLKRGTLTNEELERLSSGSDSLRDAPIRILEDSSMSVRELWTQCHQIKQKEGLGLIIIDYLQLMGVQEKSENRTQEVSKISRMLKRMAKDLDVPVIALSQLSRAVEVRGGMKRPQLSDLRGSGTIEQDADSIYFLYRPEYYHIKEDEEGNSLIGKAEVIAAKLREGNTQTFSLNWDGSIGKFSEPEDDDFNFTTTNANYSFTARMQADEGNFTTEDLPF